MVEVDYRGRFTIPKEIGLRGSKVIVISADKFFVVLPLHGDPYVYAKSWLRSDKPLEDLKHEAEEAASRARRRRGT